MNDIETPVAIVDRLRANLAAAGISIEDADIDGMTEKGLLRNPIAFEELDRRLDRDVLPDYVNGTPSLPLLATAAVSPISSDSGAVHSVDKRGHPTIVEIAEQLRRREISPVELTRQALD